jgi:hypothetical protein
MAAMPSCNVAAGILMQGATGGEGVNMSSVRATMALGWPAWPTNGRGRGQAAGRSGVEGHGGEL